MKSHRSWAWRLTAIALSCLAWSCGPDDERPEALASSTAAQFGPYSGWYLPWPVGQSGWVTQRDGSGHLYQVDFDIPGTVVAAKPGVVVFVKESSNSGCGSLSCWQQANLVVIQHDSGEYSWYYHLAYGSVPVQVGTYVSAGTAIGMEGATGYATAPHLHFMVSTGHDPWTDPNNPNAAPWATGIFPVDFDESSWSFLSGSQQSRNGTDLSIKSQTPVPDQAFSRGKGDNQLYNRPAAGGPWTAMGGVLTSSPDADSWSTSHGEVVLRGLTNEVWSRRWDPLFGWAPFNNLGTPDGAATSDPSVVALGDGVLEVFVRGNNRALWRRRHNANGWQSWSTLGTPAGVTFAGGPDAMSWGGGHSDVFVLGSDGNLWHRYRLSGTLSAWESMGAPPEGATSDPGASCEGVNACHLFVRGGDRALWARDFYGSWGGWYSLGGVITSGPDAASVAGYTEVWARGLSGNAFRRVRSNGAWGGWQDLGATP